MNQITSLVSAVAVASLSSLASAGIVVMDGMVDAAYGKALSVQNVQTQFGDSNLGVIDFANGSELDGAYGYVDEEEGYLRLCFTGNLESNFNKLEVFLDFQPGGQNTLRGDNPDVDFNGLNRMGMTKAEPGFTFDEGFEADFYVTTTCGNNPLETYCNTAQILTDGGGVGEYIGMGGAGKNVLVGSNGTLVAYNNSNVRGVTGGTRAADGSGVLTGIEIAIPLTLLSFGDVSGDIKVCAFVNGSGHDFVSNQMLGGLGGGTGNLGEPRLVNLQGIFGDQFFTVPGPVGTPCVGNLNADTMVDAADLAVLLGAWGPCGGCPADINVDGFVDAADLAILLGAWGPCE